MQNKQTEDVIITPRKGKQQATDEAWPLRSLWDDYLPDDIGRGHVIAKLALGRLLDAFVGPKTNTS